MFVSSRQLMLTRINLQQTFIIHIHYLMRPMRLLGSLRFLPPNGRLSLQFPLFPTFLSASRFTIMVQVQVEPTNMDG